MATVLLQTFHCPACKSTGVTGRHNNLIPCFLCVGTGWATGEAIDKYRIQQNDPDFRKSRRIDFPTFEDEKRV